MSALRGRTTIPEDHRVLSPEERLPRHCVRVLREHWLAFGCPDEAVAIYELPDGTRAGWCFRHRAEGELHAQRGGWTKVAA